VSTRAERRALREPIKARCRRIRDERARARFITALADRWQALPLDIPAHLSMLDRADLVSLRDAGVGLANHGWSHVDHAALSPGESAREIQEGRDWLRRELAIAASAFAVPFGDVLPSREGGASCDVWLTLSDRWPPGPLGRGVVNRVEPRLTTAAADSTLRTRFLRWRTRLGRLLRV
jgi:peptidoglycan/xylan/chitin deacetylase (PgdA/CDA1 family)